LLLARVFGFPFVSDRLRLSVFRHHSDFQLFAHR
jgi:hypothetical protein